MTAKVIKASLDPGIDFEEVLVATADEIASDATATTKGKIRLAGVLDGTADSPELASTGVVPGSYTNSDLTVGADGRIIDISNGVGGGGGSTGNNTYNNPLASLPSAADGDLWLPSDSFYLKRKSGVVWNSYGPVFNMTEPLLTSFTWVSQGSATADDSHGGINLSAPSDSTVHALVKAAPSTPYTINTFFLSSLPRQNFQRFGLLWRDSSSGKLVTLEILFDSSFVIRLSHWNSTTSWVGYIGGLYSGFNYTSVAGTWLQIGDDGTNLTCKVSADSYHWELLFSEGRSAFLNPNQVGFYASAQGSVPVQTTLLSWAAA
jgi:hypothetical protein